MTNPTRSVTPGPRLIPDPFQRDAMAAIDKGYSVLVSAPTGAGKTLVAAHGVRRALAAGKKAFYTTPLKALSNQKYAELVDEHGRGKVGLLTGDSAITPGAGAVVMTTEVLRNMILAGSDLMENLGVVILDEVHYLQDPYRGGVWEEVLILTPPEVTFVCLSATVGNAEELQAWLSSVRGSTDLIVETKRPVQLRHHLGVVDRRGGSRHVNHGAAVVDLVPLLRDDGPSPEALRLDDAVAKAARRRPPSPRWKGDGGSQWLPFATPRRTQIVEALGGEGLLPAIVFIFSRAACDDAVRQCRRDGLRLTDRAQRTVIRSIAEERTSGLSDDDLDVLGYDDWLDCLEHGLAAHHAGLVPAFRETVEACFSADLLQVVFATETLSLGINMPARTVVIERFTKFGSAGRSGLTSGEYAQLTGRAGRRGLDDEGNAVVLWTRETPVTDVARIAVAPPPDLRSSFRPTYNLAANLVAAMDRETAVSVLQRSFAHWQAVHSSRAGRRDEDSLVSLFSRRLAVMEELGYLDAWMLTEKGERLAAVYHDADLLVAEIAWGDLLADAEPAVVAGVLSSLVYERRRGSPPTAGPRPQGTRRPSGKKGGKGSPSDRLGARRREELGDRLALVSDAAERIRATEEVHRLSRRRPPDPGVATALAAWARGAPFGTTLEVAAREGTEIAAGDFVRIVRQVADLAGQVAGAATDQSIAKAARQTVDLLLRDVAAAVDPVRTPDPRA